MPQRDDNLRSALEDAAKMTNDEWLLRQSLAVGDRNLFEARTRTVLATLDAVRALVAAADPPRFASSAPGDFYGGSKEFWDALHPPIRVRCGFPECPRRDGPDGAYPHLSHPAESTHDPIPTCHPFYPEADR